MKKLGGKRCCLAFLNRDKSCVTEISEKLSHVLKEYEEIFKRNDRYYGTYYPYIITKSGVCGGECIVKGIDRITNFETTDI